MIYTASYKKCKHFSVRCSYTGRNKSSILANRYRCSYTGRNKSPILANLLRTGIDAVIPGGTKSPILANLFRTGIDAVIPGGTKAQYLQTCSEPGYKKHQSTN